jgi:putative FmdB family regulatory protein
MPIRVYTCDNCGKTIEVIESRNQTDGCKCEMCGSDMTKQVTASNFHLTGSGWYVTDYKKPVGGKRGDNT